MMIAAPKPRAGQIRRRYEPDHGGCAHHRRLRARWRPDIDMGKANISKNVPRRSFLISKAYLSDFDSGIVVFISEFIDKYHSKPAHSETPLFCLDCDLITFADIRLRIFQKGIRFNDGFVEDQFMRGRPGGVKCEFAGFDGGSKAVMRSASVCGCMAAGPDGFRERHPIKATA
jgi:hypothetical protein